jgi:phosphate transport system protein
LGKAYAILVNGGYKVNPTLINNKFINEKKEQIISKKTSNYIKNMDLCNSIIDEDIKSIIGQSLSINRCTIKAFEYTIDIIYELEDRDRIVELASKIAVEYSKTEDIYSMIETDVLKLMKNKSDENKSYIDLLKHLRKNLKIIDRLEDIVTRITVARISNAR